MWLNVLRMKNPDWDARVARATELAAEVPAAAQLLDFYSALAAFQGQVYDAVSRWNVTDTARPLQAQIEVDLLVPFFPELFRPVEARGPPRLAAAARDLHAAGEGKWRVLLMDRISGAEPADASADFFARACIEPYAEHLAAQLTPSPSITAAVCPACSAKPLLAVLRPEGEGARRSLLCSFCLTEWDFRRLLCPICGEENDPRLPVYSAAEFPHIRVEGCDNCKHFLLSIDLSRNGRAVPIVDEISAAPLDLWARQQGYTKIARNLLGL